MIEDFNIQAQADPSGFRDGLATRFKLGDVDVRTVLSNFGCPADAYIALRLGEMSGRPTIFVVEKYMGNKCNDWGALVKSIGIMSGSEEFHTLKSGHDLPGGNEHGQVLYSNFNHGNVNTVDNTHGKDRGKGKNHK